MEFGRGDPPQPPPQVRLRREPAKRRVASMRRGHGLVLADKGLLQPLGVRIRIRVQRSGGRRDGVADTPRRARRRWPRGPAPSVVVCSDASAAATLGP
jgi:hypothetical protein